MRITGTIAFILLFLASGLNSSAQKMLSFEEFMSIVKNNHPVAKQAELRLDMADATIREARGAFDPKAQADIAQKYFDGKNYYDLQTAGLKVPTWLGVEVFGGYMDNDGDFLNPQNSTPNNGLWNLGVSVPIGQGLFIDQRRATLRQAQTFGEIAEQERIQIYNELLYKAGSSYWEWFLAYNQREVYREALTVAQQRLDAVKRAAELGDRPSIDTLEAGIQVQNRDLNFREADLLMKNSALALEVFLWTADGLPAALEDTTTPMDWRDVQTDAPSPQIRADVKAAIQDHPIIRSYRLKSRQIEIESRWKREQLKPKLDLKYNALNQPVNNEFISEYSLSDYTWGLEFSIPLFLRKERGALQKNEVKLLEVGLDIENKTAQLNAGAAAAINQWETTFGQVELYRNTVNDYNGLLEGERQLFYGGESSLFMVNSRELGYINAQIKLLELLQKNRKAYLETQFKLGVLMDR